MSALTLVMTELLDMNAEEFVNVRAYHSNGKSANQPLQPTEASASQSSNNSSGIGSIVSSNSEEEPTTTSTSSSSSSSPTPKAPKKTVLARLGIKEPTRAKKNCTKTGKQEPSKDEKKDIKIMYGGRNILNLQRNLVLHQWQLTSPLANTYPPFGYSNQLSSFRFAVDQDTGAFEEIMTTCSQCGFREPKQIGGKGDFQEIYECTYGYQQLK